MRMAAARRSRVHPPNHILGFRYPTVLVVGRMARRRRRLLHAFAAAPGVSLHVPLYSASRAR
jgi:hypothetical protein